ncbi:hypothetical protein L3Y34_002186 [Caenorhabditis briggsae]|uniref:Uncharacterized protein n=1 Tax=Caenorhabditis briggsae TaxID=6238 RepID=A0AAE9ISA2_CAEBR|nr:hypothetical protein L3Y34_002186 [Caenorhabditis briggsae]
MSLECMVAYSMSLVYILRSSAYCNHALNQSGDGYLVTPNPAFPTRTGFMVPTRSTPAPYLAVAPPPFYGSRSSYLSKSEGYAGSVYSRLPIDRRDILTGGLQDPPTSRVHLMLSF